MRGDELEKVGVDDFLEEFSCQGEQRIRVVDLREEFIKMGETMVCLLFDGE